MEIRKLTPDDLPAVRHILSHSFERGEPVEYDGEALVYENLYGAFDGGRLSSDGGVMLLAMAERRLGVAERLARCFPDARDPAKIRHVGNNFDRAELEPMRPSQPRHGRGFHVYRSRVIRHTQSLLLRNAQNCVRRNPSKKVAPRFSC